MSFGSRLMAGLGGACLAIAIGVLLSACQARDDGNDQALQRKRTDSLILSVTEEGFHRVSLEALREAGLAIDKLDSHSLRLSQGGQTVPTHVDSQSMIFYGQAPDSRYAAYRPYVLDLGADGARMKVASGKPDSSPYVPEVPLRLTLEEDNFYDGRNADGPRVPDPAARDPWFWETIQVSDQFAIDFIMPRVAEGPAILELRLIGASQDRHVDDDHDLDILLNDHFLETVRFDGEKAHEQQIAVPQGILQAGPNRLVLDNSSDGAASIDIMRLDWINITYLAEPKAAEGRLVTQGVDGNIQLVGFNEPPLLFDASDPAGPRLLDEAFNTESGTVVRVTADVVLHALAPDAFHIPSRLVSRDRATLLDTENQADLIIIAPDELSGALEPLIRRRQDQGLTVKIVSVEEILNQFADYEPGPKAINAFLRYTHQDWAEPGPAYLLLVGDASYDYRDYLGLEPDALLPAPMVAVSYSGETVSDARLADVNGDLQPDMAVGRWPVSDRRSVEDLVKRTLDQEQKPVSSRAIFVADGSEARFDKLNRTIVTDAGLARGQALHLNGPTFEEFSGAWSEGAWLVTYTGHGSLDRWGKDELLNADSAVDLESDFAAPMVLQLTCLTGLFAHPTLASLSERMLLSDAGPVAVVAATSLSLSEHQKPFGTALIRELQDPAAYRVGDAFQRAKSSLDIETSDALREISDTFTLFGDPSMPISRPAKS